ncbi:MAG: ABC transporter ATP-binding protein [Verrucomicrobia bacterium]|nr:ABC transporter ATP-binding protein [Verrucomicrobiota bacterium]MCG2679911.1 ABC transporter ATP-binding protein [Kiritimatiellia bacterium]MBU4247255.1 ABC transporter ATP-binding protein [Verrucomicrobiota bacterium]MBU4290536.1 ABC transporter ATP-binding protein [Verrucomicrobiota bacterium]MBU4428496.1 ABC transporter ATP-binding protein [Verrucomicrobiota bacterium]
MKPYAFELDNVSAGYDQNLVIENLSLAVAEGEMAALLGPNGAGKSTLLRTLTGLLKPSAGAVRLFGTDVARLKAADRARLIAVVPQELNTPMAYTVAELVMMGRTALLNPWQQPSASDIQVVERALVYTDVSDLRDRSLDALSGGEKQRAVIAMALAQEPRIILMDEPTTHLDLNHSLEIMQIIERLNREQGVTVLMTSHDLNLAAEFCHRLILLDHGRVAADGPPDAVLKEEILREVYHCDLRIQQDTQTGALFVVPARRLSLPQPTTAARVHVIAGGGSGGELLRRLSLGGYRVTCGVSNQLDSDTQTAEALGMTQALEKPFFPIGADALNRAKQMAEDAAAVILCEVPFGPGNLVNIEIAEQALQRDIPVLINDRNLENRDYTAQRSAVPRIRQLIRSGAVTWRHGNEVLTALARLSH